MGVVFARFDEDDNIIGLAKNTERNLETNADGLEDLDGEDVETPQNAEATEGAAE